MIPRVIVAAMDVYLVPAGRDRHVLYCEPARERAGPRASGRGVWRRLLDAFARVLAAVEREHDSAGGDGTAASPSPGLLARLRSRFLRWIAERVADQRVLWRLQGQTRVRAFHPAGLDPAAALAAIHSGLRAESRRHAGWLGLDTVCLLLSLLLIPLPGPNMIGYYFAFRVVGHVLSIRGSRQGLARVAWDLEASRPLGELAAAAGLTPAERAAVVRSVADQLGLPRLPKFCERVLGDAA
jgi:hypothetical protein